MQAINKFMLFFNGKSLIWSW